MKFVHKLATNVKSRNAIGAAVQMLLAIVFVVASINLMTPSYIVNDNIAIMDYAIQGWPIDFTGILFTDLLHFAYIHAPGIPWYAFSLYALHCLSVFLWLRLIWCVFRPWWLASTMSGIFLLYYSFFLIFLDYTSTGAMLCMVALTWAFLDTLARRRGYRRFLLPGLVFMLGVLVRPQTFLGAMAYGFPVVCLVAWQCLRTGVVPDEPVSRIGSWQRGLPYAVPVAWIMVPIRRHLYPFRAEAGRLSLFALMFFLPTLGNVVANTAYRDIRLTPQQAQFDAFNAVRGRLHGLPDSRQWVLINDPPAQRAAHLSRDQINTFFKWRFLDDRVYTESALKVLLQMLPPPEHPYTDFAREFYSRLDALPELLLLLCCIPFFMLILSRSPGISVAGMLLPLYALGFAALFSVFVGFSPRTEMPFAFGFSFMSLLIAGFFLNQAGDDRSSRYMVCGAVACVLGLVGGFDALTGTALDEIDTRLSAVRTQQILEVLNSDYAGSVVIIDPGMGLMRFKLSPFEVTPLRFHPIDLGWTTFSPRFYQQIKYLRIDHGYELMDALINRDNAYALGRRWWAYTMLDNLNKRYVHLVKLVPVREFSSGDVLFRYTLTDKSSGVTKQP